MAQGYSLRGYGEMIVDQGRMDAYRQALQQAIKPGAIVLDIGTGPGFMAMLACQYGAKRVYAIEPGNIIQVARELATVNGFAHRIEFIQALSTQITLPERADVIVSDLRGVLPLFQRIIPSLMDGRRRFLAPGGVLIPRRDTLWASVLEFEETYRDIIQPWDKEHYGLDLSSVRPMVTNVLKKSVIKEGQMLTAPHCWASIDYTTVEKPDVQGQINWSISRPGLGHGLGLWFDAELAPGIGFSNAPGDLAHIYGRMFLPWLEPVALVPGDTVTVSLAADLVGDDYVWRWDTDILDPDRPDQPKASFRQSTFLSVPLSPAKLQQIASNHIPALGEEGRIDGFILGLMDGNHSLGDIAQQVARQFPQRFANEKEALTRAGKLSSRYGRPPDSKYWRETQA
jgi:type I protein arginine methyltransferase